MGAVKSEAKRAYDATGRRQAAEHRRVQVIDTAARLFAERGFEATTLGDIAAAAGVSVPYLQKLGSKNDLIELAISVITVGPQLGSATGAGHEIGAVEPSLTRGEVLDLVASTTAEWNRRSYLLWRAWASSPDAELRERWARVMAGIRTTWAQWLAQFDSRGWWRTDIDRAEQVSAVWLLTMAETYERLVRVAGFTHERYVGWLRRSMADVLVGVDA